MRDLLRIRVQQEEEDGSRTVRGTLLSAVFELQFHLKNISLFFFLGCWLDFKGSSLCGEKKAEVAFLVEFTSSHCCFRSVTFFLISWYMETSSGGDSSHNSHFVAIET